MGFLNWASKVGRKVWNSGKKAVGAIYHPISKVVGGIKKGEEFIDNLLDQATKYGVPSSLVDIIRDNPIYQTVHTVIDVADDIVNKDLPNLGRGIESAAGVVEDFVEHGIQQHHAPQLKQQGQESLQQARDIGQKVGQLGNVISGGASYGFTPNRDPSSRSVITPGV